MARFEEAFSHFSGEEGRFSLLPYVPVCYPNAQATVPILLTLERLCGAKVIELGVPYSDPVADGPILQKASQVAIENGGCLTACFDAVIRAREAGLKSAVVVMTYLAPLVALGLDTACQRASSAGIDAYLVVDLPMDIAMSKIRAWSGDEGDMLKGEVNFQSFSALCAAYNLSLIPLVGPTTPLYRMRFAVSSKAPFYYIVSTPGVTGAMSVDQWKDLALQAIDGSLKLLLEAESASLKEGGKVKPKVVGFSISEAEQLEILAGVGNVNGVVVGSAFVKAIDEATQSSEGAESIVKAALKAVILEHRKLLNTKATKNVPLDRTTPIDVLVNSVSLLPKTDSSSSTLNDVENRLQDPRKEPDLEIDSAVAPTGEGWFGSFGGIFVPELLMHHHATLAKQFEESINDPEFIEQLAYYRRTYIGGPTPLHKAKRLTERLGGATLYFKREELAFTGAHKINNALAQVLLAKKYKYKQIIAETGAGQHGVATATACALLDMPCIVYMGELDVVRQALNVSRMKLLGAEVRVVKNGTKTLKDAVNEAIRHFTSGPGEIYYCIGSCIGAHPYPEMVKVFQSVIGVEARAQMLREHPFESCDGPGKLPDYVVACVGGGSNAIGMFTGFVKDTSVKLVGVEAGGAVLTNKQNIRDPVFGGKHAATISAGKPGVLHGTMSYVLQDGKGNVIETQSVSAGLDYPGVGPEHAHLHEINRATYTAVGDQEALEALRLCSTHEGIIPALEPSHALAYAFRLAATLPKESIVLVNVCGRGDKDMETIAAWMEGKPITH